MIHFWKKENQHSHISSCSQKRDIKKYLILKREEEVYGSINNGLHTEVTRTKGKDM